MTSLFFAKPLIAGLSVALVLGLFVAVPYVQLAQTTGSTANRRADLLAEQSGLRVQTYFAATINAIATLTAREPPETFQSEPAFQGFAAYIYRAFPGIVAVNWVDDAYTITWVHPAVENAPARGANLSDHPQAGPVIRAADRAGEPRMTAGLNLLQGGSGFAVYVPRGENGLRAGFLNLAFRDVELLAQIFPSWDDPESTLTVSNDARDVFALGYVPSGGEKAVSVYDIPILNQTWRTRVSLSVPQFTLGSLLAVGLLLAVGIGLAVAEVLRRRLRTLETERRLAIVGENAPAVIYQRVLWPDGRITLPYVSQGIERLIGPSVTPQRVREDADLIRCRILPEDAEPIRASIARSAQAMTPWDEEFRIRRDDGRVIWLNGVSRPHRDRRGNVVWDGILIEITQRKEAELALARSEEQLRQLQRMESIGQLTGGIAHDFNNMLMIVLGNLDLVADRVQDDPKTRDAVLLAIGAAERGAELTRQLLAFARKQALMPKAVEVNDLVHRVERMLRRILGGNIEIDLTLADLPWDAFCDPAQLESALVNLALNARDAMPAGGLLTIATASRVLDAADAEACPDLRPGDYATISLSDTGIGMPPEVAARVFEPFFTTKELGRGTGLGLAMVYGFVKQSGGHVSVESEPGRGTVITLYLPRALSSAAPKPEHRAEGGL